jgi:endoglucanase
MKYFFYYLVLWILKDNIVNSKGVGLEGVNMSGAEWGNNIPGTYGVDYMFPYLSEFDYFISQGMNIFRLPFLWERLQPTLFQNFNVEYSQNISYIVSYVTNIKNCYIILDVHNYARYYGNVIGESSSVPQSAFNDLWSRLANQYKNNSKVIFGLMNEPNTMSTRLWFSDAQGAIYAIRNTSATNLILVPGNAWTGAHSWFQNWYGTSNSVIMKNIIDPMNNYAFEVHQYLDSGFSGTTSTCVNSTIGYSEMAGFIGWLKQYNFKGFLGEFAGIFF